MKIKILFVFLLLVTAAIFGCPLKTKKIYYYNFQILNNLKPIELDHSRDTVIEMEVLDIAKTPIHHGPSVKPMQRDDLKPKYNMKVVLRGADHNKLELSTHETLFEKLKVKANNGEFLKIWLFDGDYHVSRVERAISK